MTAYRANVRPTITSRAQRLLDEYDQAHGASGPYANPDSIAAVLDHIAVAFLEDCDHAGTALLETLAAELRGAP